MSGKELAKLLEANGWDLLRIQGSHHIYGQAGNPARIFVPNDYIRLSFDRVYQDMIDLHYKIDSLAIEVDGVKQSNQRLEQKIDDVSTEMNGKLDLIIRRLTGMN
jgi:HicA toxin of bacterial toxin-antitoxin,